MNRHDRKAGRGGLKVGPPGTYPEGAIEDFGKGHPRLKSLPYWLVKNVCNFTITESLLCVCLPHALFSLSFCKRRSQVGLGYGIPLTFSP